MFEEEISAEYLISILNAKDPVFTKSDEDMGERLYKCLKGNKYLIVVDDVWDIEVWNSVSMYFPDDRNGSRILITTRNRDLALQVSNSHPYSLSFS